MGHSYLVPIQNRLLNCHVAFSHEGGVGLVNFTESPVERAVASYSYPLGYACIIVSQQKG